MHKSFKLPFYHEEEQNVSVGSLKYNIKGSNRELMEMVIVLPDEKDGLPKLEVWVSLFSLRLSFYFAKFDKWLLIIFFIL